jgi:hypothetical protein
MTTGISKSFAQPRSLRRWVAPLVVGLVATGFVPAFAVSGPSNAGAPGPRFIVTHDCEEEQAFVDGDALEVARVLPQGYSPVHDPASGAPVAFVRALDCAAVSVNGQTTRATFASYGVTINSPDGTGCSSAAPVVGPGKGDVPPACNWYPLGWFSTSSAVVDWFHVGLPTFPATYAPRLDFTLGALATRGAGRHFHFNAPASTGAPFSMDASTRQRPGTLSVRGGYWHAPAPTQDKLVFAGDLTSGDANGAVSAPKGSPVARLLGATRRPYLPVFSAVASEHWDTAVYRQQQLSPVSDSTTFSGSCSVRGSVAFRPAATSHRQTLNYDYSGRGACTGSLDGRHVSDVPVDWHQQGVSRGTCSSAKTNYPGRGHVTFPAGRNLAFTLDFTSDATEVNFGFYGVRAGMAYGRGSFLTRRTSASVAVDCAGVGAASVPMDLTVETETPLVGTP